MHKAPRPRRHQHSSTFELHGSNVVINCLLIRMLVYENKSPFLSFTVVQLSQNGIWPASVSCRMYNSIEFMPTTLNGEPAHHFFTSMTIYNAANTQKPQPAINVTKLRDQRFLLTGMTPPHCLNSHNEPAISIRTTGSQRMDEMS